MAKHVLVELIGEDRRLSERILSELVQHFVLCRGRATGYGLFENDDQAVALAQEMGRLPVQKFMRYGTVPAKFHEWLRKAMVLPCDFPMPNGKSTIPRLLATLENAEAADNVFDYFLERDQFSIKNDYPELKKSFGTQQGTWIAIDNMRQRKHVRPPR